MARRSKLLLIGLPVVAAVAAAGAMLSISRSQPQVVSLSPAISPPVQPRVTNASLGFIGAAGLIEAKDQEIEIGSHTSGVVSKVLVKAGDRVKAGDPIFVLDERAAKGNLALRRAELAAAERQRDQLIAREESLKAQRAAAVAAAKAARAEMEEWADQVRSAEELLQRGGNNAISQREVTRRRNARRSAQGRLEEAQARTTEIDAELALIAQPDGASLAVANATVEQARRAVER